MTMPIILDLVAGARPNLMKVAPVLKALRAAPELEPRLIYTGQHYDANMSDVFLREFELGRPHANLEVGSGSHGAQTARILERYEAHLVASRPAACVVFGDVNSTVACALAAVKLGVPVVHVEAGLRSFDRTMPEEINRLLTDAIADLLLVSEPSGIANLLREGVSKAKVRHVGNIMIDTLLKTLPAAQAANAHVRFGMAPKGYGLVTLHRPSNVDDPERLGALLTLVRELSATLPLVFPVHPRTRAAAVKAGLGGLLDGSPRLRCVEPLPYLDNLSLMAGSRVVFTDSGGMQEETTALDVPCLTLRENTERPITLELGTSRLVGNDPGRIRQAFGEVMDGRWPHARPIPLWDGRTAGRIAGELARLLRAPIPGEENPPCTSC